jgi:hypothetical protein
MSLIDDPKMREVFEKMTGRFRIPAEQLRKGADGEYIDKETASYWVVFGIAWAESRAALVVELPPACAYEGLTQHLGAFVALAYEKPHHDPVELVRMPDIRAAIEAAGVRIQS